jgi:hypothetical protein
MRIRTSSLLLVAISLVLRNTALADASAYSTIKSAESFAIGGVGVAGTTTREELAVRALRDGGEEQLRKLLRESSPAGQMYVLFALRQRGAADFKELAEPFCKRSTPVQVISGCIIHTDPMSTVVSWIDEWAAKSKTWERP